MTVLFGSQEKLVKVLRRAEAGRVLLTTARKLEKAGLAFVNEGTRYRREEWGKEVGPVFATVQLREPALALLKEAK